MLENFITHNYDKNFHKKFFQRLHDIFNQDCFSAMNKPESKLRIYKTLKNKTGFENYLSIITSQENRISLTKLRLSNHQLNIEKGRHENIPKEMRFCPFCVNTVENEVHFLLQCKTYDNIRKNFIEKYANDENFQNLDHSTQFSQILTDMDNISEAAHAINKMFHCRNFILEKHKNFE